MIDGADDPKVVRARNKRAVKKGEELDRVLSDIMRTSSGRSWIWSLLEQCHVFHTGFKSDALAMAFEAGERNIGLRLFNDVTRVTPNEFVTMLREGPNGQALEDAGTYTDEPDTNPDAE